MAGSLHQVSKPMSVKEISAKAHDFEFNPYIALKYWLRTADTLLREAHIYQQEQNDQQAYLLLMRYAVLISDKVNQHPAVRDPENRAGLKAARNKLPGVVEQLELLKPKIHARYAIWQQTAERRRDAGLTLNNGVPGEWSHMAAADPAVAGNVTTLAADENSDLAVKLAHSEIRRRETKRRATRQAGVSDKQEQERRTAGLWDDWESALSRNNQAQNNDDIQQRMIASRRKMEDSHNILPDGLGQRPIKSRPPASPKRIGSSEYRYPSIPKSQPLQYEDRFESQSRSISPTRPNLPPKPPKEKLNNVVKDQSSIGHEKDRFAYDGPPSRPEKGIPTPTEEMTPSNGQQTFTFKPSAYLENGKPLRTVFLPPTLRDSFLEAAAPNTRNNLETCGMLCGTLISNALFISKVVIPEQESTSDTCETINESDFFDYCASEDLMVLGWIHTHPTQTCFMSSRDLHTHCGYQTMMAESIAIVCAPSKNPSWGVFRLTNPPGLNTVMECRKTGLFHPHEESNIYTDALRPGHVFEAEGLEFQVVDLRPKK